MFIQTDLSYLKQNIKDIENTMLNLLNETIMIHYAIRKRIKKDGKLIESYRLVNFGLYTTYEEAKVALDEFINAYEYGEFKYSHFINGYIPKNQWFDNYTICYDIFGEIID